MFKKILLVLLVVLILIQFIHPARNISRSDQSNNIIKAFTVPPAIQTILDKACMDCHSNNTRYRWYFKIQPVDWLLTHHITEGKRGLNFDEYANRSPRYQYKKLEEIADQVKAEEMPINSYTWTHKDAILTEQEKKILVSWTEEIRNEMKAKYPPDSLAKKRQ